MKKKIERMEEGFNEDKDFFKRMKEKFRKGREERMEAKLDENKIGMGDWMNRKYN